MANPFAPKTELYISGAWVDVTSYVRYESGITITRGRDNDQGELTPSVSNLTLTNTDGRFSNRNPSSPYYGILGRNTPIRHTMTGLTCALLNTAADTGTVSCPDVAALDIVGDIDVRADVEPDDWAVAQAIVAKSRTTSNQRSWALRTTVTGYLQFSWSPDGTSAGWITASSTVPVYGFGRLSVRVTLDVNNGAGGWTATFYTSDAVDGTWTQLGDPDTDTGVTSIFSSTSAVEIGTSNNGGTTFGSDQRFAGRTHRVQIRSGIAGSIVADPDFTAQAEGATSFSDGIQTWTESSTGSITGDRIRYVGEVPSWPARWDLSGRDVYVPIEAAGITRRLTQGASPLRSAIYRNLSQYSPTGYWTFEDGSEAETAASAVAGGSPARVTAVTFAGDDTLPGSATAVTLDDTTTRITGVVRRALAGSATGWAFMFFFKLPSIPGADNKLIAWTTGGAVTTWQVSVGTATYILQGWDSGGTLVVNDTTAFGSGAEPNQWVAMQIETEYAAGTTTWTQLWHGVGTTTFYFNTNTYSGTPGSVNAFSVVGQTALTGASLAHVWAGENTLPFVDDTFSKSSNGYQGETAIARFERLCSEEDVTSVVRSIGTDSSAPMGRQQVATFITLVQECADADLGILYEPRDQLALGLWPYAALLNGRGPTLNYGTHIAAPFEPVDDDKDIRNTVTATRTGGSSAEANLEVGALSILPPPAGVGRYDATAEVNVYSDEQLPDIAGWLVHLGTWDALRYPQVSFKLGNTGFSGSGTRTIQAALLDVGSRFTVASLPSWLPPDPAECLVQGYAERFTTHEWDLTCNATPGAPWSTAVLDSTAACIDTDGSDLNTSVNAVTTTLIVDVTSGPLWSSVDGSFDINLGGERITVATVTGSSSPQTFSGCTRSVNGVSKSHTAGADIRLWTPAIVAI